MSDKTPLERAIEEQIAYLQEQLATLRAVREHTRAAIDNDPLAIALRDPGFQHWLLQKQLEGDYE